MSQTTDKRPRTIYVLILIAALIHGLVYVFSVPLWEHFDEPGHFDYLWMVANRSSWPQTGDYDNQMRRELAESMIESGFIKNHRMRGVNLRDTSEEIWVGLSQTGDRPLYYFLTSLPVRLLKSAPLSTQAYAARLVSLLLFLLTIVASMGFARELSPPGASLRWLLPTFVALLPGFVDTMTAINNCVIAITLAAYWLWLAVRLIKNGPDWLNLILLTLVTILSFFSHLSAWFTIGLYPIALLLTFMRRKRWILLVIAGFLAFLLPILSLRLDHPAYWIPMVSQEIPLLTFNEQEMPMQSALQLQAKPDREWGVDDVKWHSGVFQVILSAEAEKTFGKTVVIGAWVWADQTIQIYGPGINVGGQWYGFPKFTAGPEPIFVATRLRLPEEQGKIQVWLRSTTPEEKSATIYFTGVVLAKGQYPVQTAPSFTDPQATQGQWGNQTVYNLVRNPFFLQTWPSPTPWVKFLRQQGYFSINSSTFPTLASIVLDPAIIRWYPVQSSVYLLRTFWDSYSWGSSRLVPIPGILHHPYRIPGVIMILCLAGFVLYLIRNRKELPWAALSLLAIATLAVIGIAYAYGLLAMGGALLFRAYFSSARFIYPVILPLSFVLCAGWIGLVSALPRVKDHPHRAELVLVGFMLLFAVYAWYSLMVRFS